MILSVNPNGVIARTTVIRWPNWTMGFVEYHDGTVISCLSIGEQLPVNTVANSLTQAVVNAQEQVRWLRKLYGKE